MKDSYGNAKKMARKGGKMVIYESKFFTSFFFFTKSVKTGNGNFSTIAIEPIKVQTCSASQNDRLNLTFVKDTHGNAKKWGERMVKW